MASEATKRAAVPQAVQIRSIDFQAHALPSLKPEFQVSSSIHHSSALNHLDVTWDAFVVLSLERIMRERPAVSCSRM